MAVVVEVHGVRFDLRIDEPFTFGRDTAICTVSLGADPLDRGISRLAGSIGYGNGIWWIINRSSTRCLHVVDLETGMAVPLPVARENWPPPRHPVDRHSLAVLVMGEILTHEIVVIASEGDLPVPDDLPRPVDQSTTTERLSLTDNQRAACVALLEGYLLRHPRYNPEPRTYEEAARRLGLPTSTVKKRIENVRRQLVNRGVPGLEGGDARRNLAEWLLSSRLITAADLGCLNERRSEGQP
ncbi:MAG: helix-turn-helix transcriptional regulator [Acidimicrobiales bacterium]